MKLPAMELWVRTTRKLCPEEGWFTVLRAFARQLEPGPRQVLALALYNAAHRRSLWAERRRLAPLQPELRRMALGVALAAWRAGGPELCAVCLGHREVGALHETSHSFYTCSRPRCSLLWAIIRPPPAQREPQETGALQ